MTGNGLLSSQEITSSLLGKWGLGVVSFVKGLGAGGQLCWVGLDGGGGWVGGGLPCQLLRSPSPGFR